MLKRVVYAIVVVLVCGVSQAYAQSVQILLIVTDPAKPHKANIIASASSGGGYLSSYSRIDVGWYFPTQFGNVWVQESSTGSIPPGQPITYNASVLYSDFTYTAKVYTAFYYNGSPPPGTPFGIGRETTKEFTAPGP